MCGVIGILMTNGAPADADAIVAMRDALAHRGPDDAGLHMDGNLGLGHRRLSIIDLSNAARQPMASPDGDVVISYNGEIYNFRALRDQLEQAGWQFRTRSDTEVLIAGFRIWGMSALVSRLDGMAAFALWDRKARRLFLVARPPRH